MSKKEVKDNKEMICYHCGDICRDDAVSKEEKLFCCTSCKLVYEILEGNDLCKYYDLEKTPGISPSSETPSNKFNFLEDEQMRIRILDFTDSKVSTVTYYIPQIHCSSCIWLLENLYKLSDGILFSEVNFLEKKLYIKFSEEKTSLRKVVELLDSIGYEPLLSLDSAEKKFKKPTHRLLYYKIGIAGFAFGNIMLLSFPEYLGLDRGLDSFFGKFIGFLSVLLSLPVLFYSSSDYFKSAFRSLKKKVFNIDVPLSLGILVLFLRSLWEIVTQSGAGYFDSFSGLVFFLLLGKLFQSKTYDSLDFERNYRSYFPLSVTVIKNRIETTIPVSKIKQGDRIIIRNKELIPADSILFRGNASIDYSFVTGESMPVDKVLGEIIYAGGRQIGNAIELEVLKEVSQSYLTQLWNNSSFKKEKENKVSEIANTISKYFTFAVITIALISGLLWLSKDLNSAINVFTAVLIVACPCALALSIPFTLGNTLRIFGRLGFYLKNTGVIEKLTKITTVVFDKTGTITKTGDMSIQFFGRTLTEYDRIIIKAVAMHSTHILSRRIYEALDSKDIFEVENFKEYTGRGIYGIVDGNEVMIGSLEYLEGGKEFEKADVKAKKNQSDIYLSINGNICGYFRITSAFREGLEELIGELSDHYDIHLLSGDNSREKPNLLKVFAIDKNMRFRQSPEDKLNYIKSLQKRGKSLMMIGDGLNDAGALNQSDVGVTISDNVYNFSPACDAILDASMFNRISDLMEFSKFSIRIIIASFIFSLAYNIIGLAFAVNGLLTPVIAAILMPVSSISVVLFTVLSTNLYARRKGLKNKSLSSDQIN